MRLRRVDQVEDQRILTMVTEAADRKFAASFLAGRLFVNNERFSTLK
jgi:hypothetical protein